MILELNEVLLEGVPRTLSLMARSGSLTCLTGGSELQRRRWLFAMMGLERIVHGFISIDGEPLTDASASVFRRLMAYAPQHLTTVGEVVTYEPPSIQDVFNLKVNREQPISNGILAEEIRRVGGDASDSGIQLLAVAVLLDKPILFVDNPRDVSVDYIRQQVDKGKIVIVASDSRLIKERSDVLVEL